MPSMSYSVHGAVSVLLVLSATKIGLQAKVKTPPPLPLQKCYFIETRGRGEQPLEFEKKLKPAFPVGVYHPDEVSKRMPLL